MHSRQHLNELHTAHLGIRKELNDGFAHFSHVDAAQVIELQSSITEHLSVIKSAVTEKQIKDFYTSLEYILKSMFFAIRWSHGQLNGNPEAASLLAASKANAGIFLSESGSLDPTRPSTVALVGIAREINELSSIEQVVPLVRKMSTVALPVYFNAVVERRFGMRSEESGDTPAPVEPPVVISVLFYIDQELWANPQLLRKEIQYSIKGELKFSRWPTGYQQLSLTYATTSNDDWFILSLPVIAKPAGLTATIEGSIVFKYTRPLFEKPASIKLVAYFRAAELPVLYPQVIGYDELRVKVSDLSSFPYLTGYEKLNQKAYDIAVQLEQEVKHLPVEEMKNFMELFSAILNYQGYCAQHAEYKDATGVAENDFRDRLIRYLSARNITTELGKEGHLAGGRVEINYKGIVAELKIENSVTERTVLIDKYSKQPAAYATAVSGQLSILCILDAVKKEFPPALTANNVFLVTPQFHGFEETAPALSSRIAVVIIDANMPSPSKYK